MDNGRGVDDFEGFATYASSKEGRNKRDQDHIENEFVLSNKRQKINDGSFVFNSVKGEHSSSSSSNTIGKYGVGAKDAGSYLGDQLSVLSRFNGDEIRLLRFHNIGNHRSTVKPFPSTEALESYLQSSNDILTHSTAGIVTPKVIQQFTTHGTCTVIIIKLRERTINLLKASGIEGKIASYYHFYLHPDDKRLVGSPLM